MARLYEKKQANKHNSNKKHQRFGDSKLLVTKFLGYNFNSSYEQKCSYLFTHKEQKLPAEMAKQTPRIIPPPLENIHPIIIPKGFRKACNQISFVAVSRLIFAFKNVIILTPLNEKSLISVLS